jgi:hypothetical protein
MADSNGLIPLEADLLSLSRLPDVIDDISNKCHEQGIVLDIPRSPDATNSNKSIHSFITELERLISPELPSLGSYLQTAISRIKELHYNSGRFVPIHRLPYELLSLTFSYGTERRDAMSTISFDTRHRYYQDNISQVCRLWRSISIETGALWTDIDCVGSTSALRIPRCIERSGDLALSLYLTYPSSYPAEGDHFSHRDCLQLLRPHFYRLNHLTLHGFHEGDLYDVTTFVESLPPQRSLKSLELSINRDWESGGPILDYFIACCAQRFRALSVFGLHGLSFRDETINFSLPKALVTKLSTLRMERSFMVLASDLFNILQNCHRLEVLILSGPIHTPSRFEQQLTLPNLRHFSYTEDDMSAIYWFLKDAVILPDVELITLRFDFNWGEGIGNVMEYLDPAKFLSLRRVHLIDDNEKSLLPRKMDELLRWIRDNIEVDITYGGKAATRDASGLWSEPLCWKPPISY